MGPEATNFRPITCLPEVWKLFTSIIGEVYHHQERRRLLPDEQKGCRRNTRGTKDQLLIDKTIKNCRKRLTGLSMAWIDSKKAFDMFPLLDCELHVRVWGCKQCDQSFHIKYEVSGRRNYR